MAALFPVIDLLRGQVVRAVRGQRSTYQPVQSTLCSGSDPCTVAQALCRLGDARPALHPQRLYVADLDALQGGATQVTVLQALLRALPGVQLWLDAGFADASAAAKVLHPLGDDAVRVVPVFGSETLLSLQALADCIQRFGEHMALSLDRRDGQPLDPAGCWNQPESWPRQLIVMTLERVGSGAGPDLETIRHVRQQARPGTTLIGAGGVRHAADLAACGAAGADAWLVASALHDGRL